MHCAFSAQRMQCEWRVLTSPLASKTSSYAGVSKSFRTGLLEERELQMVQPSAARCGCIAILWVSLMSFAAITLCVASQWVCIVFLLFISLLTQYGKFWMHLSCVRTHPFSNFRPHPFPYRTKGAERNTLFTFTVLMCVWHLQVLWDHFQLIMCYSLTRD
jgi:hypothetical protein